MTIITKSGLAAELRITRGRVTQYITRGMPVRKNDGKLDREKALAWINRNVSPTTSSRGFFSAAATRARDDDINPVDAAVRLALAVLFTHIPGVAAEAARQAGVADEHLEKIPAIAHELAVRRGNLIMTEILGLEPRGYWPDLAMCRRESELTTGDN